MFAKFFKKKKEAKQSTNSIRGNQSNLRCNLSFPASTTQSTSSTSSDITNSLLVQSMLNNHNSGYVAHQEPEPFRGGGGQAGGGGASASWESSTSYSSSRSDCGSSSDSSSSSSSSCD